MLHYEFMQKAFLVGIILACSLPLIGIPIVLRRTSMTGDALAHCSLAGVAAGLLGGIDPVLGALIACIIAGLSIEAVKMKLPRYADLSIAVVSAIGAGLAGVFSSYGGTGRSLDDYLFGSIVAVDNKEILLVVGVGILVILFAWIMRRDLFLMALDSEAARTSGVNVRMLGILFAVVSGAAISISARAIGSLVVSSVLVLPIACSLQLAKSYRQTISISIFISVFIVVVGISMSYYFGMRPGGAIVLLGAFILIGTLLLKKK